MKFAASVVLLFLVVVACAYPQSYKIKREGKSYSNGFFSPQKSYEIRKMPQGSYSLNCFYVKSSSYLDAYELKKIITNYLNQKGYTDLKITNISKPFDKFIKPNLLRKSNSHIENIFEIQIENSFDIFELCSLLTEVTEIEYAVPMIYYKIDEFRPNDTDLDLQWALEAVDLFKAWDIAKGDKTITIGIVDSGVDIEHEDLSDQLWVNTGEIPKDGIDNDQNGFVDDVHGWDFVGNITHNDAIQNKYQEDNNVVPILQSNNHGTHVAGLSSAQSNNSLGIASSGYDVTFLPVKAAIDDLSKSNLIYRPYEAMLYAALNGADVINCSWSSAIHDPLAEDVINEVLGMGVLIVAAAGNENTYTDYFPFYPANIDGVISVGSINSQLKRSKFSNYGVKVDCYAPGESMYSTINGNKYSNKNGTSMAAPFVAGIVATMTKIFPEFSPKHYIKQIRSTAKPFDSKSSLTYGIINAFDAFRYNNPDLPAYKSKGIGIEGIQISGSDAITQTGDTEIKIIVKNYLSSVNEVKISFLPQDNYFSFSNQFETLQNLAPNESREISLNFNLDKSCPWFDGDASFLVSFESGNYYEYEFLSIPIKLETSNRFQLVHNILENASIYWISSDSYSDFDYWAVGYDSYIGKSFIYNFGKLNRITPLSSDVINGISAADNSNVMITANSTNSVAKVMKSTNSGLTFKSTDLSTDFSFVSGVKYYTSKNAFVYGINTEGIAEIAYSDNDGETFTKSNKNFAFSVQYNELITSKLVERNNIAYLGTSIGRIIKSDDLGKTWSLHSNWFNDSIVHIAVINDDSLFAIIKKNGLYTLQASKNGGKTFSKIDYDLTILSNTLKLLVPDGSKSVYVFEKTGKLYYSNDFGQTWEPELSSMYNFYDITTASLFVNNGKARMWLSGSDINYLDFNIIPSNIIRNVAIAGSKEIKFDTINIDEFVEEIVFIENKGNIRSNILSQRLANGVAFELSEPFKTLISPSELISATIKFKPETEGFFTDTLIVETDADTTKLKFVISGNAVDPTSVNLENDISNNINFTILSSGQYEIEINSDNDFAFDLVLYDITGRIVENIGKFEHNNYKSITNFSINKHTNGVYLLGIGNNDINKLIKLIISE